MTWRKSTFSDETNCVELSWRKSSYTTENQCVEVAWPPLRAAVRDSKHRAGPVLTFGQPAFSVFVQSASALPVREG
jgi:hypothetical protein